MKIESVDFFYCAIPEVKDIGDGSQDALLVRVQAGGYTGWGECEASPLVSIANWVTPMSHSSCRPVKDMVLGKNIDSAKDILAIHHDVKARGMDIAQTDHTLSGIDIALWDLLGKKKETPVYKLLGYKKSHPRIPYASVLFEDTPQATFEKAKRLSKHNFRAVKFGCGPYGWGSADTDRELVEAAREGLGKDVILSVDVWTIWGEDVNKALARLEALEANNVLWLEEPFPGGAYSAHKELASHCTTLKLSGGEGSKEFYDAKNLIDYGGLGFIQIDTGRIGGITPAKRVADYAEQKGVTYINHTFTTHLALSASLQPFANHEGERLSEYPVEASPLAMGISKNTIERDAEGMINIPDAPGLGIEVDMDVLKKYLQDVSIEVNGKKLYETPSLLF